MKYIHNQRYNPNSRLKAGLWALVAVTCAFEIATVVFYSFSHNPSATRPVRGSYEARL